MQYPSQPPPRQRSSRFNVKPLHVCTVAILAPACDAPVRARRGCIRHTWVAATGGASVTDPARSRSNGCASRRPLSTPLAARSRPACTDCHRPNESTSSLTTAEPRWCERPIRAEGMTPGASAQRGQQGRRQRRHLPAAVLTQPSILLTGNIGDPVSAAWRRLREGAGGVRTPIPVESVHRFRRCRTPRTRGRHSAGVR